MAPDASANPNPSVLRSWRTEHERLHKSPAEQPPTQSIINTLGMQAHIEGGYFVETDRDPLRIPNPFINLDRPHSSSSSEVSGPSASGRSGESDDSTRSASTTIYYLLTPTGKGSLGRFHRNKGRTVHTLHWGRGRYVLIHEDGGVESFVVGKGIERGERLQWIVGGGKYKASFLLPDEDGERGGRSERGLLISETVVPGFEYVDHDFLREEGLQRLVSKDEEGALEWLLRRE